ncbi:MULTISPECIES: SPW repeat protein [Nitrobacteraceae]|jgi:sugar phosphate permease|nr:MULTISPECIES: SPW repeat protein [Nitrobacteraceae]KIU52990.1 hypothetical protein QU41_01720 [Bradyrhizobium elkanii]MBN9499610.1 SPW repeat protein [Alphaproteobacteria bacterium]OJV00555.1 MAG: hypothetical protein BGO16_07795 [Nitrobacter sp. 62-23]
MFQRNRKTEAFVDFINLALGGFLILSPWLLGFKSQLGWHTSWMAGAAIGVVAIFSIADLFDTVSIPAFFESEEWINLTIGSWLAICPWVLNFNDDTMAMQVHLVVGIVVAAIGAVELWVIHHRPAEKERDKLC